MSRPVWICPACGDRNQRKSPNFCTVCDAPLDKEKYQEWLRKGNKPMPNGWKPEPKEESKKNDKEKIIMENTNRNSFWQTLLIILIIAGIIIMGGVVLAQVINNVHEQSQRIIDLETAIQEAAAPINKVTVVTDNTDSFVANVPNTATNDEHFITVFRGNTDQETINFNDAWPGYSAKDNINWFNANGYSKIHMLGGTYILPCDGVISGDVKVNGVPIYDNNEKTFLVINVKKGNSIDVNSDWMAWFTNAYSEDLIVQAVQTQFPTWTRQSSNLN